MGSILIIQNNYEIEEELQKKIKTVCNLYIAQDVWEGLDIIEEHYVDAFAIISEEHIEKATWEFLNELRKNRSKFTNIIFISATPSKELQVHLFKNNTWCFIPLPIVHDDFMSMVKNAIEMANFFDDKSIILRKNHHDYRYQVKNILKIERSKNRYIKIYTWDPLAPQTGKEEEFFYDAPLYEFIEEHGIEKQFKQAYQSWLVNEAKIVEIRRSDLELVLADGSVVPTSKKFINNFSKGKNRKDK